MVHGDAREGKWRGNWRMECVASTLHITSEHGVSNITTADAHTSAASSRLNWRPCRFKWTLPFRRKTKYGFCACAITFQLASNCNRRRTVLVFGIKWRCWVTCGLRNSTAGVTSWDKCTAGPIEYRTSGKWRIRSKQTETAVIGGRSTQKLQRRSWVAVCHAVWQYKRKWGWNLRPW